MALEINEIGIRMRVCDSAAETAQSKPEKRRGGCDDVDREEIVDDVVRRVLEVLATLRER